MKQKIPSIQVIRAIAFVLIFLSHVELIATGPIGVSLFMVLSGFCMTYSYLDKPEKTPQSSLVNNLIFAWGKIKKLYPLHLATLLFVAAVIFAGMFLHKAPLREIAEQGGYFVANSLLLQSWIPWREGYFSFNAVSWYLSTTAFSYFLFPWVFSVIQSKNNKNVAVLTCVTLGLMIFIAAILGIGKQLWGWNSAFQKWVTYISPFYRAGDFIIGLTAGYVYVTHKGKKNEVICTILELIVVALMTIQVVVYNSEILHATNWMLTLFWLPTSVLCVYLFALNQGVFSMTLQKSKWLIWIGDISAEAFLIHQICIKAVEVVTKNKIILTIVAFAVTLLCTVIWRYLYKRIVLTYCLKKGEV